MGPRLRTIALLVVAIAPAAWLAWNWRAMPQLGFYHDDTINWVSAKSIADGEGYRIPSLPNKPWQTKYPPVLPALLALIWKLNPAFPSNVSLAMLAVWLALPVYVFLTRVILQQFGLGQRECWVLTFAAALNPLAATLATSLMPELLFTTLLLVCVLMCERALQSGQSAWLAAGAGLVAGAAYLTKSAGLPLLLAAPLCFALRRNFRGGLLFMGGMLPAVTGWQIWVLTHASKGTDLVSLYYTNYFGFQTYNVPLGDIPRVAWYNLDALLKGIGRLLTFDTAIGELVHLERVVAIAAIAGVVRLAYRSKRLVFPLTALFMAAVMLVWHYQPDQRFVFPLYPLLAAGLWTELRNVATTLRRSWNKPIKSERIGAAIGSALLASFAGLVAFTHICGLLVFLPRVLDAYRSDLHETRKAYSWIAAHTPPEATFYAYDDPLLYLYTGRRACGLPIPTKLYYHDDESGIDRLLRALPSFAREQRLGFVLLSSHDFYRDLHEKRARMLVQTVERDARFIRIYQRSDTALYQWAGQPAPIEAAAFIAK